MANYPRSLQNLIGQLKKIPGIGPKSAERIAFFLLGSQESYLESLGDNLKLLKSTISKCPQCFSLTDGTGLCDLCQSEDRDKNTICVVESYKDVLTIETMGIFKGAYHVLEGHLSPLDGMTPDKLRIKELFDRVTKEGIKEVIMATNPNVEGDATAYYIAKQLKPLAVKTTRLAKGIPVGTDLEYADNISLLNSIKNREEL